VASGEWRVASGEGVGAGVRVRRSGAWSRVGGRTGRQGEGEEEEERERARERERT
jgi:hypothetical protein